MYSFMCKENNGVVLVWLAETLWRAPVMPEARPWTKGLGFRVWGLGLLLKPYNRNEVNLIEVPQEPRELFHSSDRSTPLQAPTSHRAVDYCLSQERSVNCRYTQGVAVMPFKLSGDWRLRLWRLRRLYGCRTSGLRVRFVSGGGRQEPRNTAKESCIISSSRWTTFFRRPRSHRGPPKP